VDAQYDTCLVPGRHGGDSPRRLDDRNDETEDGRDRAAALREIREAYNAVFEKLFDAGVFERKLGTLDMAIRNTPLPEEKKQTIREVFGN
jgi:hypothetical protein